MPAKQADLNHLAKGTAVLAACIVQTLSESDRTFQDRFVKRIEKAYYELRDNGEDNLQELGMLSMTRELLTGFNLISGQGKPFLS